MNLKSRIAILTVNILLCVASIILTYFFMGSWGVLIRVAFYALAGVGIAVSVLTFVLNKLAIFKSAFILIILAVIVLCAFIAVSEVGHLNDYENDEDKIQGLVNIINSTGAWGMVVFVLIQILQIVVLPLPAIVCYVPGTIIWGPLIATLLASAGVLIGSVIAYFIGRLWGKKAVIWIAGKEATEKYSAYFGKRGKVIFILMQILPFFPDDILCMIAGLTSMNFAFFFVAILLVRPLIIAAYCYLGSGTVIPFEGWGIAVWIAIFVVFVALAVLSLKYQDKFEGWLLNKFSRKKKTETAENTTFEPIIEGNIEEINNGFSEKDLENEPPPPTDDSGGNGDNNLIS
ncbi:MAG: TVP38/TMEM64 family protein [Clostridia bacterium]|nr:TVP38/TMEM64 family protein [Clostridia bacterium]